MTPLSLPKDDIRRCAGDPGFLAVVGRFYAGLDRRIADHHPVCRNCGDCCKFTAFDHHLFVTTVELAYWRGVVDGVPPAPPDRSHCPYQRGGRCTIRGARPAGCRVFFCDPRARDWQPDQTEAALRHLRAIGRRFDLPYAYLEWTDALRVLGGAGPSGPGGDFQPVID